jgi:hypothetical protein
MVTCSSKGHETVWSEVAANVSTSVVTVPHSCNITTEIPASQLDGRNHILVKYKRLKFGGSQGYDVQVTRLPL